MRYTENIFQIAFSILKWGKSSLQPSLIHKIQGIKPIQLRSKLVFPNVSSAWIALASDLASYIANELVGATNSNNSYAIIFPDCDELHYSHIITQLTSSFQLRGIQVSQLCTLADNPNATVIISRSSEVYSFEFETVIFVFLTPCTADGTPKNAPTVRELSLGTYVAYSRALKDLRIITYCYLPLDASAKNTQEDMKEGKQGKKYN